MRRGLNLGCGMLTFGDEYVNVDLRPVPAVQVRSDLSRFPWPWKSSWAERIYAYDILEHIPDALRAIDECWRILAKDGRLIVHTGNWKYENAFTDWTHCHYPTIRSFDFFDPSRMFCQRYGFYSHARFQILEAREEGQELFFELAKLPKDDGSWQ